MASDKNEYTDKLAAGEYDIALVGINVGRDGDMRDVMARDGKANYGNYYDAELYELACANDESRTTRLIPQRCVKVSACLRGKAAVHTAVFQAGQHSMRCRNKKA